jgi:hypothetical protein
MVSIARNMARAASPSTKQQFGRYSQSCVYVVPACECWHKVDSDDRVSRSFTQVRSAVGGGTRYAGMAEGHDEGFEASCGGVHSCLHDDARAKSIIRR